MLFAKWIVRYDIPEGSGVPYEPTPPPGHYDIRGNLDELRSCLVPDFKVEVRRQETKQR